MAWKTFEIGSFLKERGDRFKPEEANTLDLKRIKKIDFQGKIHVIDHKPTKTNMILVKKGDLVISGINVEKGALSVYEEDENALATIHYSSYEYDKNQIDIEYLKWFLKSRIFQNIVKEQAGGGIKTELKPKKFLPLKIQLPGLNKQIDIARKIENVASKIGTLGEINEHNEKLIIQLRQAILEEAVQGKLIPQDPKDEPASELLKRIKTEKEKLIAEGKNKKQKLIPPITENEIPYELPNGWEWVRLGDICNQITDGTHHTPHYVNQGVPFLSVKDISKGKIDFSNTRFITKEEHEKLIKRCKPEFENILFTKVGTTGIAKVVDVNVEFSIFVSVALLKFSKDKLYPYFWEYLLNSPLARKQSAENTQGIGNKNLVIRDIARFLIPIPPLAEQKRIVAKVDQLMHLCDELETRLSQSKKDSEMLMQAVLHEAFS